MSPTIPREFYLEFGRQVSRFGGFPVEVLFESCRSGPSLQELRTGSDPFSRGEVQLAFLCAPTYIRAHSEGIAALAGFTPVFGEVPKEGAVYHSKLMVVEESPYQNLEDLRGTRWAYNDTESLSGYFSVLHLLRQSGEDKDFFSQALCSGGHRDSIRLLQDGLIDCAAIDANLLLFLEREGVRTGLRSILEIGPYPAPPIAIATSLSDSGQKSLKEALAGLRACSKTMTLLRNEFLLGDLIPVKHSHYEPVGRLITGE